MEKVNLQLDVAGKFAEFEQRSKELLEATKEQTEHFVTFDKKTKWQYGDLSQAFLKISSAVPRLCELNMKIHKANENYIHEHKIILGKTIEKLTT